MPKTRRPRAGQIKLKLRDRRGLLETLEARQVLAADWFNQQFPSEVNASYIADADGEPGVIARFISQNPTLETSESLDISPSAVGDPPDLAVAFDVAPSTAVAGDEVQIRWTVTNVGTNPTSSQYWFDLIVLSTDQLFDGSDGSFDNYFRDQGATPLAPGDSYTISRTVTLPASQSGPLYLLLVTDAYDQQSDSNRDNNVAAVPIEIAAPDLAVSNFTAPSSAVLGAVINVGFTVTNASQIAANSGFLQDSFYLSDDDLFDETDVFVESIFRSGDLEVGGSYTKASTIRLRDGSPQHNYLILVGNDFNNQAETDRSNNVLALPIRLSAPNITAVSGSVEPIVSAGQSVVVSWEGKNTSSIAAPGVWEDALYLSQNDTFEPFVDSYLAVEFFDTPPLDPNESYQANTTVTIPGVQPGSYYILVHLAAYNQPDTDGSDNMLALPIEVEVPDLEITAVETPAIGVFGESMTVSFTVTNHGPGTAAAPFLSDAVFLSQDTTFDYFDDTFLGAKSATNHVPLGPGESYTQTITFTLHEDPPDLGGGGVAAVKQISQQSTETVGRYLLFRTDYGTSQPETNENNNLLPVFIEVSGPDLVVTDNVVPSIIEAGIPFDVQWTVTNQGSANANLDWADVIYLSDDDVFDSSDVYLNSDYISDPLAIDASYTRTIDVTVPAGTPTGRKYVIIDTNSAHLSEIDKTNNYVAVPIQVGIPSVNLDVTTASAPSVAVVGTTIPVSYTVQNLGTAAAEADWIDHIYVSNDSAISDEDVLLYDYNASDESPLVPGGTYSPALDVYIPSNLRASETYQLLIVTDKHNTQAESDETDNLFALPFAVRGPDLVVTALDAPDTTIANSTITVRWVVENQGNLDTTATWFDGIYLSTHPDFESTQLAQVNTAALVPLAISGQYEAVFNVTVPNQIGDRFLVLHTNDFNVFNQQAETNTQNNRLTRAIRINPAGADLETSGLTGPATATVGEEIELDWTVTNVGGASANANWVDTVYLSDDDVFSVDDTVVTGEFINDQTPLSVAGSYHIERSVVLPEGASHVGAKYLLVVSNSNRAQNENAFENNVASIPITISSIDLAIESVELSTTSATYGEPFDVTWKVRNLGEVETIAAWFDSVYLSADDVISFDDIRLVVRSAEPDVPLPPGESYTVTATVTPPIREGNVAGPFKVLVAVDAFNHQPETIQANNQLDSEPLEMSLAVVPDLIVADVVAPLSGFAEEPFGLEWKDRNEGALTARGPWIDRVYISTDDQLDIFDAQIGEFTYSDEIAPSDSVTRNEQLTFPGTPSNYWLFVVTDDENAVAEGPADSNNASIAVPVTVLPPLPPDLTVSDVQFLTPFVLGTSATISYEVANLGDGRTRGEWSEWVFLSTDDQIGNDRLIGDFRTSGLEAHTATTRTQSINMEVALPFGDYHLFVVVDGQREQSESNEENNLALAASTVELEGSLRVVLSSSHVAEGAPPITGYVVRSGDAATDLVVELSSSLAPGTTLPATVTIPTGSFFSTFDVHFPVQGTQNPPQLVTITAEASGFVAGSASVNVADSPIVRTLQLEIVSTELDEGQSATATIRRNVITDEEVVVTLSAGLQSQLGLPPSVVIPAYQDAASFQAFAVDDALAEDLRTYSIRATAFDYQETQAEISILPNDFSVLSLVLDRSSIVEGGQETVLGYVTRDVVTDHELFVQLETSDSDTLLAPKGVVIPAGESQAVFSLWAPDNNLVELAKQIELRATALDFLGEVVPASSVASTIVNVLDDDSPLLQLGFARDWVREGDTVIGTVRREGDTSSPIDVNLTANQSGLVNVPAVVTIPAGQSEVTFFVEGIDDGAFGLLRSVVVMASNSGFGSGVDQLVITDRLLPDLRVSQLQFFSDGKTGELAPFSIEIVNDGDAPAIGTVMQRVYLSDSPLIGTGVLLGEFELVFTANDPLAPGETAGSTILATLPAIAGEYWLHVITDDDQVLLESVETNNHIVDGPLKLSASYRATVSTDAAVAPVGTPIHLQGTAFDPESGNPVPDAEVIVRILTDGTRREIMATTDASGNFTAVFQPLPGEAGAYEVAADPASVLADNVQDEFVLVGMRATPASAELVLVEQAAAIESELQIVNLGSVPLTQLTAIVLDQPANLDLQVNLIPDNALPGNGQLILTYSARATSAAVLSGDVTIRVVSAEGFTLDIPVRFAVTPRTVAWEVQPGNLSAGMLIGAQTFVEFQIANIGGLNLDQLSIELPEVPWISLLGPATVPGLAPSQTQTVTLSLLPPADLDPGLYTGTLLVSDGSTTLTVPFAFQAVSEAIGSIAIEVVDDFTFYAEGAPKVAGAEIRIIDSFSKAVVADTVSDQSGLAQVANLPAGYYDVEVTAAEHAPFLATVRISAGETEEVSAFLSRDLLRYIWTVEETEIEERTDITIISEFETNVPVPLVTVEPGFIDLDSFAPGETRQIVFTITNHGLIASENTKLDFTNTAEFQFDALINDIGTLAAKASISIPVLISRAPNTAGLAMHAMARASASGGGGCPSGKVTNNYKCGGTDVQRSAQIAMRCHNSTSSEDRGNRTRFDVPQKDVYRKQEKCECKYDRVEVVLRGFIPAPAVDLVPFFDAGSPIPITQVDPLPVFAGDGRSFQYDLGDSGTYRAEIKLVVDMNPKRKSPQVSLQKQFGESHWYIPAVSVHPPGKPWWWRELGSDNPPAYSQLLTPQDDNLNATATRVGETVSIDMSIHGNIPFMVLPIYYDLDPRNPFLSAAPAFDANLHLELTQICFEATETTTPVIVAGSMTTDSFPSYELYLNGHTFGIEEASLELGPFGLYPFFEKKSKINGEIPDTGHSGASLMAAETDAQLTSAAHTHDDSHSHGPVAEAAEDVCATVKLQLDQTAVNTRDAFRATLVLDNSLATSDLSDLEVQVVVTDENGVDVSDLFFVQAPTLTGIGAVDGTGTLAAGETGSAKWIIIPSPEAAIDGPTEYEVSGFLTFVQHGNRVAVHMAPAPITVHPTAKLQFDYFHERDVFSDDPFTAPIEPAIPYSLGVIVQNIGAGIAENMRIESAQPRIIENEKGLLVDFKIIDTEVNGESRPETLTADLGDIDPGGTAVARWQFISTLQGHFTDYSADISYNDDLGGKRFSLIDSVRIHETNHVVSAAGTFDDGLPDFLVNDAPDSLNLPDAIFLSNGNSAPVSIANNPQVDAPASGNHLQVQLAVDAAPGWTYLRLTDPGDGRFELVRVVRSDGIEVPLDNIWITDRSFSIPGERPVYENILHLLDHDSTGAYTLIYEGFVDTTPPTSTVEALPRRATSETFPIVVSGNDFDPSGAPGSGIATYDIYVATDGGPFVLWQRLPAATPTAPFTAESNHTYAFHSIARDTTGNVEVQGAPIEASTYVPDLSAPATSVTSIDSTLPKFHVHWSGSDTGTGLRQIDLIVQVDGGAPSRIDSYVTSTAIADSPALTSVYNAIQDGQPHTYRFFAVGTDRAGNVEIPPSDPADDVSFVTTFAAAPSLELLALLVNDGGAQRSLIKQLDAVFNQAAGLDQLIATLADTDAGNNRLQLRRFELDGSGPVELVALDDRVQAVDRVIEIDFGFDLGGTRLTLADGYYELGLDLDGNGSLETVRNFHRLFGDVSGNGVVDQNDFAAITAAFGQSGSNLDEDANGDGVVNALDRTLAIRNRGRRLAVN